MNEKLTAFAGVAVLLLTLALASAAHADGDRRGRRGPPAVAIDACESSAEGAACSFVGRHDNELTGTCETIREMMVCVPEDFRERRGRGRERPVVIGRDRLERGETREARVDHEAKTPARPARGGRGRDPALARPPERRRTTRKRRTRCPPLGASIGRAATPSVIATRSRPGRRRPSAPSTARTTTSTTTRWAAAGTALFRLVDADYADGVSALAGPDRPSAREISNWLSAQPEDLPTNPYGATDFLWQWGQFLDHDIDLTDGVDPPEPANIAVPTGDPHFDPDAEGGHEIEFNRSIYSVFSGSGPDDPREQLNEITAWIDASNVYGSDEERTLALRTLDGSGKLRESEGRLLPYNDMGLPNAGGSGPELFLAGDVRANEQVGLAAMHTLFVREHNRIADRIRRRRPKMDGDRVFMIARRLVGAQMQAITYREFLPALLGPDALPPYTGYDPEVDASIANVFSTGAYRFGHSALSPTLLRLDASGDPIPEGHLALRDAFFRPDRLSDEGGIDPLLRGLAAQACQKVDGYVIDDVRNFLFGAPGAGGFDLPALNIQRGRDHGLPGYNDVREALGLGRARTFAEMTHDPEVQARLAAAYADPDEVDLWIGGLVEPAIAGGHLGTTFRKIVIEQFTALRDGDRFWYERDLPKIAVKRVNETRLSDIIRRNTGIGDELQDDVFYLPGLGRELPHWRSGLGAFDR